MQGVKPVRDGDREVEAIFRALLIGSAEFHLMPITTAVLERVIQLRAEFGLRTPDAIHAATALEVGCVQFVTNDVQFRRVTDLPVIVLVHDGTSYDTDRKAGCRPPGPQSWGWLCKTMPG